ncbi:linear amide C-N hydrolase [Bacteroides fragilis]|nr:linear amide C-N hydrolase [Bacteroides fragilis]
MMRHRGTRVLRIFQLVSYVLAECSTVDEVKEALSQVRVININPRLSTAHWRFTEASGRQVVLEMVNGKMNFYDNPLGVLTNSRGLEWHWTNLNNYTNLQPGHVTPHITLGRWCRSLLGMAVVCWGFPAALHPPSPFFCAPLFQLTAPQQPDAKGSVFQAFHILNNFDIPTGSEQPRGKASANVPSATQPTVVCDIRDQKDYYRTMYNKQHPLH